MLRMEVSVDEAHQPHEPQQPEEQPPQEDAVATLAVSSEVIAVPTESDILCGKEKECLRHSGSRRFREVVEMHQPEYHLATTKKEKMAITYRVYRLLAESNARFLKFSKQVNGWQAIPHTAVRDKISHALRCIRPKKNKKSKTTTTTSSVSPGLLLTTTSRKDNKKKRQSSTNDVLKDDTGGGAAATTSPASRKRRQLSLTQGCRTKSWPLIAPAVAPVTAEHVPEFMVSSVSTASLPPQGVLLYEDEDEDNSNTTNERNVAGSLAGATDDEPMMTTPTITQEPPETQVDSEKLELPQCYLPSSLGDDHDDDYEYDLGDSSDSQGLVGQQPLLKEGGQHYSPLYYDAEKTVHLDMLPPMMVAAGGVGNDLPCLEDTTSEQTDNVMESGLSTSLSSEDASCPPDFLESISQDKIPDCMSITHPTSNNEDEDHQEECDFPLEPLLSSELSNFRATIKNTKAAAAATTTTTAQERKDGLNFFSGIPKLVPVKEIYKSMVNNDDFKPVCNCPSSSRCWFNSCCWMLNYSSAS